MKSTLLSLAVAVALLPLAACQSSNATGAAEGRTFELTGTQARATEQLPNYGSSDAQQPYALQGYADDSRARPMGMGYQAR